MVHEVNPTFPSIDVRPLHYRITCDPDLLMLRLKAATSKWPQYLYLLTHKMSPSESAKMSIVESCKRNESAKKIWEPAKETVVVETRECQVRCVRFCLEEDRIRETAKIRKESTECLTVAKVCLKSGHFWSAMHVVPTFHIIYARDVVNQIAFHLLCVPVGPSPRPKALSPILISGRW